MVGPNSIDPRIELRELPSSDLPYDEKMDYTVATCDEFLIPMCNYWNKETALWNPWLRQVIRIEFEPFLVSGFGYDNTSREKVYKMLGVFRCRNNVQRGYQERVAIYYCATNTFKFLDIPDEDLSIAHTVTRRSVFLNGNLYWVSYNHQTPYEYFILSFDFSREVFKPFCLRPCLRKDISDQLILAVYKRDRFSLLKGCYKTRNIEILVTKKNIERCEEEVVWIHLMTLPTDNLPSRVFFMSDCISYLVFDKTIFMCCGGCGSKVACIYIVRKDLCKEFQIGSDKCSHCVYTPNFISLPLLRN
ncbi:protein SUPPRESSOR OF NIM1 1 [Capsella rubella]|nr:protein SUPPRESSOR OF NIM1 1 [Capsella rubella]